MQKNLQFIHLKVHSSYSLLEGALPIPKLGKLAQMYEFPALALTDSNNLFGALEFSEKLYSFGIQPIIGVSLSIAMEDTYASNPIKTLPENNSETHLAIGSVTLIALNEEGYKNLIRIVTDAHLNSTSVGVPCAKWSNISSHSKGLVLLTGGPIGPIDRPLATGFHEIAQKRIDNYKNVFGSNFYVEIQRHNLSEEKENEPRLLKLAYDNGIPLVATNEVYFGSPDEYEAHDVLLCIADGRYISEDGRRKVSGEHYFKNSEEMVSLFGDLPEALENSVEIAKRCCFRPIGKKPILPSYVSVSKFNSPDDQAKAEAEEFQKQAKEGLRLRFSSTQIAKGFTEEDYWRRLNFEINVITKMNYSGYFLIVADFIKWSKLNKIPVGPGRGSGAGSLVAWALTITDLDPLRFGLLFERFLNPDRVSMPDFDIDFCQEKRDAVINYVQEKFGSERVAQIITHGKLQARAVLRDVGRVLQMPYPQVDRLCRLIPNNPASPVTLSQAIDSEPKLQEARDQDPIVARLLQISQKLEGLYRHASTHAAGIVIADRPLIELVPLCRDANSNIPVSQFNWKMTEAAGLVKFDFLGLKTLTVIDKTVILVQSTRGKKIEINNIPLDDAATFNLLSRAETIGVFQLESTGMRESLKRLKPDRIEDIIAMVSLYRPGPMSNIPTYINRKHGVEPVDYLHPLLENILKETYGVIIYQEQVMQIAQVLADYSLGEADLLRRAMGKKDKHEMARQQARFIHGSIKNNVSKDDAIFIFDLVEKFAGYGFNKSHAAAYALLSYQTAFLKANYCEEFLAASMSLDKTNTDKLSVFCSEAKRNKIDILPPSINFSDVDFLVEDKNCTNKNKVEVSNPSKRKSIRYSLAALKNIGDSSVKYLVINRKTNGNYVSLANFAARLDHKSINKRALETLSSSGAFDELEKNRALIYTNVDAILSQANRLNENKCSGTNDLFSSIEEKNATLELRPVKPWTQLERLQFEFDALGFYLSGHPLDSYENILKSMNIKKWTDFETEIANGASAARLAGIILSLRERRSQKGNKFAFGLFSDTSGQFEAVIFSETLNTNRHLLETGSRVLLSVIADKDGDATKLRVQTLEDLDRLAENMDRKFKIYLDSEKFLSHEGILQDLKLELKPNHLNGPRGGEVHLVVMVGAKEVELLLPGRYDISPACLGKISTIKGVYEIHEC